jgi:hypothetical protein
MKISKYLYSLLVGLVLILGAFVYYFRFMTMDLVKVGRLNETEKIEIWETDFSLENIEPVSRLQTKDQKIINDILVSLSGNLKVMTRSTCVGRYSLDFYLKDGSKIKLFYTCDDGAFAALSGNDSFFRGKDVKPPAKFGELLKSLAKSD